MTIRTLPAEPGYKIPEKPHFFPDMALAHRYCQGQGLELGAAAHNPFNLTGAINVAPFSDDPEDSDYDDFLLYKQEQSNICGYYALVDLTGEANKILVPDNSQNYVISSHVVEHIPDLIAAFLEWNRILIPGGIVFMIFPKRDALAGDAARDVTPLRHYIEDFTLGQDVDSHSIPTGHGRRGHYHVFTLESMLNLIEWSNQYLGLNWKIEEIERTDSKVGNGHTVVARYLGPLSLSQLQLQVASSVLSAQDKSTRELPFRSTRSNKTKLNSIKSVIKRQIIQTRQKLSLWLMPMGSYRRHIYLTIRKK